MTMIIYVVSAVQHNGGFLPNIILLTRSMLLLLPIITENPVIALSQEEFLSLNVWSSHIARVWINRVRLPILLVVS